MEQIIIHKKYLTTRNKGKDKRFYTTIPNGKRISVAKVVMMNFLHTNNIPRAFHVHHIDGDKLNDSIENLQIMLSRDHASLHMNPNGINTVDLRRNSLSKYNNKHQTKNRVNKWKNNNREHLNEWFRNYYHKNRTKILSRRKLNSKTKGDDKNES